MRGISPTESVGTSADNKPEGTAAAGELARAATSKVVCRQCGLAGHMVKECQANCPTQKKSLGTSAGHTRPETSNRARRVELILDDAILVKTAPDEKDIVVDLFVEGKVQPALVDCVSYHNTITAKALSTNVAQEAASSALRDESSAQMFGAKMSRAR